MYPLDLYDYLTITVGDLFWLERPESMFPFPHLADSWNARYAGKPALACVSKNGYKMGMLLQKNLLAHRVVWAMTYFDWPNGQMDHIDHDRLNNDPANLRLTNASGNAQNITMRMNNTSGFNGVTWNKRMSKWLAQIEVDHCYLNLGYYANKTDAVAARMAANAKYGFHENHGKIAA